MLFALKEGQLGRVRFDVRRKKNTLKLYAGDILGIVEGTEFAVYSSEVFSVRERLVGYFTVKSSGKNRIGATTCTLHPVSKEDVKWELLGNREGMVAIASPTSQSNDIFRAHAVGDRALECTRLAVDKASECPEDDYGRPRLEVSGDPVTEAELLIQTAEDGNELTFSYAVLPGFRDSNNSIWNFLYPVPTDPPLVRRVLRSAAHFFKFLHRMPRHPTEMRNMILEQIDVCLLELTKNGKVDMVDGKIVDQVDITLKTLTRRPSAECADLGMYNPVTVRAIAYDDDEEDAPEYRVEIENKLQGNGFFVWMFFFDLSTLEISAAYFRLCFPRVSDTISSPGQYYQPRTASEATLVDWTLPMNSFNAADGPKKVALNFRDGGGDPLQFRLNRSQSHDLGYLRIFLSTKFDGGGLSSIAQPAPLEVSNNDGQVLGATVTRGSRGPQNFNFGFEEGYPSNIADYWDVITIPLIQAPVTEL